MKCWYCKTNLGEPYFHGQPAPVMLTCDKCPTEVLYHFGMNSNKSYVYRVSYHYQHNGKDYAVAIEPEREDKFALYKVEGNLWLTVVKSKSIPNINPTNMGEKIRTYLIFL